MEFIRCKTIENTIIFSRGNVFESFQYDDSGRLTDVSRGNMSQLKYVYRDVFEVRPSSVLTGSNSRFSLDYDEKTGGLKNIQTPRGHFHAFRRRPTIGGLRFQYQVKHLFLHRYAVSLCLHIDAFSRHPGLKSRGGGMN